MNPNRAAGLGFFIVVGLLLFTAGLFYIGSRRQLFSDNFEVYTEFANISGLQNGSRVRVSGKDAGEVTEVHVPRNPQSKFRVKIRILEELHGLVRTDSIATIQTEGVVGNKFMQVEAGTSEAPPAPPGSTIPSREPFEIADLLEQARDSVVSVTASITQLSGELQKTIAAATVTIQNANQLVEDVGDDVKGIMANGQRTSKNLQLITADITDMIGNVREGKGSVGKLIYDDELYKEIERIAAAARVSLENMQQATQKANEALGQLQKTDDNGQNFSLYLRNTLKDTSEVMSDMADNMEALKRNWFFRRYYSGRGYYDLDTISLPAYKDGVLLTKERATKRIWISANELYDPANGVVKLSEEGKERLREAMAEFHGIQIEGAIIMVEGYATEGSPSQLFILSRTRAATVETFLLKEFELDTNMVGVMAMGSMRVDGSSEQPFDGVALVLFYDKSVAAVRIKATTKGRRHEEHKI